jgi:hypothetical protein
MERVGATVEDCEGVVNYLIGIAGVTLRCCCARRYFLFYGLVPFFAPMSRAMRRSRARCSTAHSRLPRGHAKIMPHSLRPKTSRTSYAA